MNPTLDACALLAYLRFEPGGEVVERLLQDLSETCYAHSLNLCEVYYHEVRASDEPTARRVMADLFAGGVHQRSDMDNEFWMRVGELKARGGIALADCVCLALAERLGGTVVTSDHKEFDPLVPLNICPILFIR